MAARMKAAAWPPHSKTVSSPAMKFLLTGFFLVFTIAANAQIKTPSEFLGFEVGADRKLADYKQISAYLRALDAASPRLELESLGKTVLGEDMLMAVISSEENIRNKTRIQEQARKLADPRGVSDAELETLIRDGKSVVLVTLNIHSTE